MHSIPSAQATIVGMGPVSRLFLRLKSLRTPLLGPMRRTNMEAEIWQREVTQDEEAWRLVRVSVRDARSGTLNRGQRAMKAKYEYKVLQVGKPE